MSGPPESQKKKQNQDDSDEEEDDDEPGPSFQHPPAAQAPAGYNPAMGQPAPVMPPAGYQGKQSHKSIGPFPSTLFSVIQDGI